jgi:hypothetical protein
MNIDLLINVIGGGRLVVERLIGSVNKNWKVGKLEGWKVGRLESCKKTKKKSQNTQSFISVHSANCFAGIRKESIAILLLPSLFHFLILF